MENESPFHSEILYLGSHRCCSFILLSLHLQTGTASLYTIVIFVLSMFFHLFYVFSLAVFLFQIYAKKKILKAFLCYYHIIFWILVSLDPRTLSLSPVACPARTQAPPARARPGGSSPPCRVPILEAARRPLPGLN